MKKITVLVAAILLAACSKPAPTEEKAAPAEQTAAVGEIYTGVLPGYQNHGCPVAGRYIYLDERIFGKGGRCV